MKNEATTSTAYRGIPRDAKVIRFSKAIRRKVAEASDGLPTLGEWIRRIQAIDHPALDEAVSGIWCGRGGEVRIAIELQVTGDGIAKPVGLAYSIPSDSMLCMGWHHGRVEWSYLS